MTSSQCGPYPKPKSTILLNSPSHSTPHLNSRMKCHQRRSFSWIPKFLKARGSLPTYKILDVQTHFKPTETFQYTNFSSCHPLSVKKGFVKGEALRLLRTNSVKESFEFKKLQFLTRLLERGYPKSFAEDILTEIKFSMRSTALQDKPKTSKKIIPFVTTFNPSTPNLKRILSKHWHLIAGNRNLAQIFKNLPMVAYRKDKSLKNYLVRARTEFLHFNLTTKELYTVGVKWQHYNNFVTTFNPATPNLKKILIKHCHLIAGNHNLVQIFKNPPMVAYRKDKSLKNYLVRARIPSF